jgi:hypothetical protein
VVGAAVGTDVTQAPHIIGHSLASDPQNVLALTVAHVAVSGSVHSGGVTVGAVVVCASTTTTSHDDPTSTAAHTLASAAMGVARPICSRTTKRNVLITICGARRRVA